MSALRARFGTGSFRSLFVLRCGEHAREGPLFAMVDVAVWLGEEFSMGGIVVRLPDSYKIAVTDAISADTITVDDVPADNSLDDAQFKYLFEVFDSAARDAHKAAHAGADIGAPDTARWKKWLSLRWAKAEDVVRGLWIT